MIGEGDLQRACLSEQWNILEAYLAAHTAGHVPRGSDLMWCFLTPSGLCLSLTAREAVLVISVPLDGQKKA